MASPYNPRTQVLGIIVSILVIIVVSALGNLATSESVRTWYPELEKPPLTPPGWIFGPVWTLLYLLIAVAAWLTWRSENWGPPMRTTMGIYGAHLLLNAGWSLVFFGLQSPLGGIIVILALIAGIILTMVRFSKHDKIAPWLLVPYLAWVTFATYLNLGIWALN
jgi:translocator protein